MAILCDVVPPSMQTGLLHRILNTKGLDEMAISYFSFLLFEAMVKTGNEHLYLDNLGFWYRYIERGHTTCGETGFESHDRSDCHAWSAHPAYHLLSIVCGIKPEGKGFNAVKIKPHLGDLKYVKADMPHLKGRIEVEYRQVRKGLQARIVLPSGMNGSFEYKGFVRMLKEGENSFIL